LNEQRWLGFEARDAAAAIELGYLAGNLHWKVRFAGASLWVQLEGDVAQYRARVAALLSDGRARLIEPEARA
jgi:urease accessory protein